MDKIRAVIVDDERLARNRLRRLLAGEPDIEVAAECAGGREALEFLVTRGGDLLFLDVQMPDLDGFGVLEALPPSRLPLVIFVTAYDEHALHAFEVHALDYLLKPFDRARFGKALDRARRQLALRRGGALPGPNLQSLLEQLRGQRAQTVIPVKNAGRIVLVRMEDLDWIEAADNYVCLHAGAETHVLRETMSALEARLDARRFVRIHRSAIVNIERIKELRPWFHGEYQVLLTNGAELTLSRSYRDRLLGMLE